MDLRIKQRDKWSCRRCGHKFDELNVFRFGQNESDDDYITLCNSCLKWALDNTKEAETVFSKLLRKNKIVLIGDCHGHFSRLNSILTNEEPFDFFVSVGDVTDYLSPSDIAIVDKWKDKGYYVRGNHDNVECFNNLELTQEINGINISGLNGMLKSRTFIKDTSNNISFREVLYLSHLRDIDILVTHQSPTSVFDNIGEPVLEELLNYLVPKIYVFGHVHRFKLKFHLNTFVISLPLITRGHAVAYFVGRNLTNLEIVLKRGRKFIRI